MFTLIIVIFAVGLTIFYISRMNEGLRFEETCSERIQKNTNEIDGAFIEIGEARSILRTIIDILNRVNIESGSLTLIRLKQARVMAVMIHHQSITLAKGKEFDQIAREALVAYKSD
jgi:hypothetical protein